MTLVGHIERKKTIIRTFLLSKDHTVWKNMTLSKRYKQVQMKIVDYIDIDI